MMKPEYAIHLLTELIKKHGQQRHKEALDELTKQSNNTDITELIKKHGQQRHKEALDELTKQSSNTDNKSKEKVLPKK